MKLMEGKNVTLFYYRCNSEKKVARLGENIWNLHVKQFKLRYIRFSRPYL